MTDPSTTTTDGSADDDPSALGVINEDVAPAPLARAVLISEDVIPGGGQVVRRKRPKHIEAVRARLAGAVVAGVFVLWTAVVAGALARWIDREMVSTLATALGGPTGLAAAVVGFYYGRRK